MSLTKRKPDEQAEINNMLQRHEKYIAAFTRKSLQRHDSTQTLIKRHDVEDCIQFVYEYALKGTAVYDATRGGETTFLGLIIRSAVSLFMARLRAVKYREARLSGKASEELWRTVDLLPDSELTPEDIAEVQEFLDNLRQESSERDREILDMLLHGFSMVEISKEFGVSRARITQIKNRIRNKAWTIVNELHMDMHELAPTRKQIKALRSKGSRNGFTIITKLA